MEQREDLPLMALGQPRVGLLIERRPPELHAVLLGEPFDLAVADHRQSGQRRHHRRDAEVLVALAELLDRGLLIGVAHEVDVALEDLGVEFEGLAHQPSVAGAVLVAEHVHERAVVDAVHAEGAHEIALEHPERLGQEERVGHLGRDPVDDLAPELDRHARIELGLAHGVRGAGRDAVAGPGLRPPQPSDVALGEDHRSVETDHREAPRDVDDGADDLLPDLRVQEVELRGVVPRKARAVVAVVDEAFLARRPVEPLEHDRGIAVVPVVVLDDDSRRGIRCEVGPC